VSRRVLALIAVALGVPMLLCCGGAVVAVALEGGDGSDTPAAPAACQTGPLASAAPVVKAGGFDQEQTANAAVIVHVGQQMGIPARGWVIAVATAMQESDLRNSRVAADHDSVGLFQQRPSQGWGSVDQIMDPAYASRKFYEGLTRVPGWQQLPLTVAAQRVQKSAFPGAYAKHETAASALVDQITGGAADLGPGDDGCATGGQVTASGWTAPVAGAKVGEGFGVDRGDHRHAGVDLIVAKHTAITSVAAGTVIRVECDAGINCDRDGSSSTPGCGWYVDIRHDGGIISRYCHQLVRPLVSVGDHVAAGQQIGWSGTSGHSSGPHVHFEIHTGNVEASKGAVDPVPFMASKGVKLGG
jgi:murein DD-endopeptidase MepM/ murein hydrolase activator NlpD